MYAYALEELAWAVAREREEEARRARPHTEDRPKIAETVTEVTVSPASPC